VRAHVCDIIIKQSVIARKSDQQMNDISKHFNVILIVILFPSIPVLCHCWFGDKKGIYLPYRKTCASFPQRFIFTGDEGRKSRENWLT